MSAADSITEKVAGRRRGRLPKEDVLFVRDSVGRVTSALPGGCFRADMRQLTDEEARELHSAIREAPDPSGATVAFGLKLDSGEYHRIENLMEKASGRVGEFEGARERARVRADFADLARELVAPPSRPRYEEPGTAVLPPEVLMLMARNCIWLEHVALLAYLNLCWEGGQTLGKGLRITDGGDAIELDARRVPFGAVDPESRLAGWKDDLDHLERNDFLRIEKRGSLWTLRRGPRMVKATRGTKQRAADHA